jgi:tripartite-type tricarboxylate transporter receptor subunit TctC
MRFSRRRFLHLASLAALPTVSPAAWAQAYPSRPIRLVVPFPPGGAFDTLGRPLAERLKRVLGTVIIENIGGGGSSLGAAQVAHAAPDGYTILLGGTLPHVNEALLKSRPLYDPLKDLDPIANVASNIIGIAVHPSVPAKTLAELIAYAKANPGKLSYGHVGIGSTNHLARDAQIADRDRHRAGALSRGGTGHGRSPRRTDPDGDDRGHRARGRASSLRQDTHPCGDEPKAARRRP